MDRKPSRVRDEDRSCIRRCKCLIEERLSVKESRYWRQRDFEYLRSAIFQKTGTLLSVSTFKRLWRDQHGLPHPSTLDALASFLEYRDWYTFKQSCTGELPQAPAVGKPISKPTRLPGPSKSFRFLRSRYSAGVAFAMGFTLLGLLLVRTVGVTFLMSVRGFQVVIQIQSFLLNIKLVIFP